MKFFDLSHRKLSFFFPKDLPQRKKNTLILISAISFFWSTSSLMVVSILPSFLVDELGMNHKGLGMVEGVALCFSFLAKVFSGVVSDWLRSRKPLIVLGSLITVIAKIGFSFCYGIKGAFLTRFLDRFSKGIRSAPTDALLADICIGKNYGFVYGFRQSLYTGGAVFGAILTMVLLASFGPNYRSIFSIAAIPATISLLLGFKINLNSKASMTKQKQSVKKKWITHKDLVSFPHQFWYLIFILCFIMLARFSEAFITLRMKDLGLSLKYIPIIVIVMDVVHVFAAFPFGKYADLMNPYKILLAGLCVQLLAALTMAFAGSLFLGFLGISLIGVSMGMTQGVIRALIAQSCPKNLIGSGFALFYLFSGVSVFLGNSIAGYLGDEYHLSVVFLGAAFFTSVAIFLQTIGFFLKSFGYPVMQGYVLKAQR